MKKWRNSSVCRQKQTTLLCCLHTEAEPWCQSPHPACCMLSTNTLQQRYRTIFCHLDHDATIVHCDHISIGLETELPRLSRALYCLTTNRLRIYNFAIDHDQPETHWILVGIWVPNREWGPNIYGRLIRPLSFWILGREMIDDWLDRIKSELPGARDFESVPRYCKIEWNSWQGNRLAK